MRHSNGCVLFVTQKEQFEGELPVGVEQQSLWYHLHILCLFSGRLAYCQDFTIHFGKR